MHGWTKERVESALKLWEAGEPASRIAMTIGGVTRNAVIGLIHRRGKRRADVPRPARPLRPKEVAAAKPKRLVVARRTDAHPFRPTVDDVPIAVIEDKDIPADQLVTLFDRRAGQCCWPIGDPLAADFRFCGGAVRIGSSYCGMHAQRAVVPRSEK